MHICKLSLAKPLVNCPGRAKYHYRGIAWLPFQKDLKKQILKEEEIDMLAVQEIEVENSFDCLETEMITKRKSVFTKR